VNVSSGTGLPRYTCSPGQNPESRSSNSSLEVHNSLDEVTMECFDTLFDAIL